ncbi:unnamed protein product [Cyclocybe aegerita]|uniref:Transposase family Tnp2 protein n=1 Tax=Cyclocybe aegerita TaxID=1973307 RepID=A0A8S0X8H9_CYCAE|nr:unnamed protein product [Cyclocybe aegerita]
MPPCYCLQERSKAYLAASAKACEAEDEMIANAISKLTLSGSISPSLPPSPLSHKQPGPGTQRARIEQSLQILRDVECDFEALKASVLPLLSSIGTPKRCGNIFPLRSSIAATRLLQDRLSDVSNRASSLNNAQKEWNSLLKKCPGDTSPLPGNTFNSGCSSYQSAGVPLYALNATIRHSGCLLDPDTVTSKFGLEGKYTIMATCPDPSCHKTYAPKFEGNSPIPIYPKYCTHKQFSGGSSSNSFTDYTANISSHPGFEDIMDGAWDKNCKTSDTMHNIFDSDFLRDFKGPDGKLFGVGGQEGRYGFSMSVDFFSPYTNKQAGKKCSIGVISLVCLNLPPSMRYKPENMFLAGVIPGLKEPPLTALNHYLTPLIDELLTFWESGVHISKTFNYPDGRLIRCALIALICDLPAARKTAGFAASSHEHFCLLCHCTRSRHGYGHTDTQSWRWRTNEECRHHADQYISVESVEMRAEIFNDAGIRWSELLRLPYFDITHNVVVDSMHNLFLGLIKEHFCGILSIALPSREEEPVLDIEFGQIPAGFTSKERKSVKKLRKWLQAPLASTFSSGPEQALKKMKSLHLAALKFACEQLRCPSTVNKPRTTKGHWADSLLTWQLAQTERRAPGADTSTAHGFVLSQDEVEEIWSDIRELLTPSWLTSVPSNVVIIATSHTMSQANADAYLMHMRNYIISIKCLFPTYKFCPNHHMALHIREFLIRFSPVHAWWTFPFERLIGMLQRMPSSGKIGELEETITKAFTRAANLRALPLKASCLEIIQNCQPMFQKMTNLNVRDALVPDMRAFASIMEPSAEGDNPVWADLTKRSIPEDLSLALAEFLEGPTPSEAHFLSHLSIDGVNYATSSKHAGNSCVLLHHPHNYKSRNIECLDAAQIKYIVQVSSGDNSIQTYIGLSRYLHADVVHDPYSRFPAFPARLSSRKLGVLEIATPDQLFNHFACLPVCIEGRDLFAVLSLSHTYLHLPPVDDGMDVDDVDMS